MKLNIDLAKRAMIMEKYDIFISYRRDGGSIAANHMHFVLTSRGYRVFLDTDNLGSGDFDLALIDKVKNCKDFMIILSPGALDQCNNPNDWVRRELVCALENRKNIIPVRMDGFSFPKDLPEEIDSFRSKNCFNYDVTHFSTDITKLEKKYLKSIPVKLIRKILLGICLILVAAGIFVYFSGKQPGPGILSETEINSAVIISETATEKPASNFYLLENTPDPANIKIETALDDTEESFDVDARFLSENDTDAEQIPTKNVIIIR